MGQTPLTITQQCVKSINAGFETLRMMSRQDEQSVQLGNGLSLRISRHNPDLVIISRAGLGEVALNYAEDVLAIDVMPEARDRCISAQCFDRLDLVQVEE